MHFARMWGWPILCAFVFAKGGAFLFLAVIPSAAKWGPQVDGESSRGISQWRSGDQSSAFCSGVGVAHPLRFCFLQRVGPFSS
jgi:hypothetical protein